MPLPAWGETIDGQSKMEIARAVLSEELDILPENVDAGLRIFGGELSESTACEDTTVLVEPATGRRAELVNALVDVNPSGDVPLTEAIVRAIGDFDPSQDIKKTLIIITAGLDTCEEDAIGQLETLSRRLGIEFDLQLIGLGVADPGEQEQLREIADAAGGDYHNAQSKGDIIRVVEREVSLLLGTPVAAATTTPTPISTATPPSVTEPSPAPAEAVDFPADNVSDNPGRSVRGRLAFDDAGNLHVVWHDNTINVTAGENGDDLLHRMRTPDGVWSEITNLTDNFDSVSIKPPELISRPDGTLCVFWHGVPNSHQPGTLGLYQRCYIGGGTDKRSGPYCHLRPGFRSRRYALHRLRRPVFDRSV
ncbi:MAG: hypothetical protein KDI62_08720 [Anaerolineae bacterium]|nr:hypothetical protein [Anaerolineae bacterium]MCB9102437.1 hypothetical protein [Anaerolineales bacterium]MCB9106982.1 hypothetical protein [Anaerolineales bacterium]